MRKIYLPFVLFAIFNVRADLAKVKFVRGDVSALKPYAKSAEKVILGANYPEETSIVTADKSIVKFELNDGSIISLGPKGKLVLHNMNKKNNTNIIGILKGVIRAEVTKEQVKDPKMIIKTRSAVMGVRGTTFKSVYNPSTKNTTLVTIEGEVAMAKVDEVRPSEVIAKQKEIIEEAKKTGDINKIKEAEIKAKEEVTKALDSKPDVKQLKKVLETEEVVAVTKGQYAGVIESLDKPTQPVKVSPNQLIALAKKDELAVKVVDKPDEEIIKEVYTQDEITKEEADKKIDLESNTLSPRSGGFIDFKTGLYVPPPADSKFDEERHVFVAKEEQVGKIDDKGEYVPPKGIIIDEVKGFVVDTKEVAMVASNEELKRLQNQAGLLNGELKEQVKEENVQTVSAKKKFWKDWFKVKNNLLSASLTPRSEVFTLNNTFSNSESEIASESSMEARFTWKVDWSSKWMTDFALSVRSFSAAQPEGAYLNDRLPSNLMSLYVDFYYEYNSRLNLILGFGDVENIYFIPSGGSSIELFSINVPLLRFGADYRLYDYKKIQIFAQAFLESYGRNNVDDTQSQISIDRANGLFLAGRAVYDLSQKYKVEANAFYSRSTTNIGNFLKQTSNVLGIGGNIIWDI